MKNRAAFKRTSKGPRSHKLSGGARVSYTATEAKHEFGQVLEKAIHCATVVITRHNALRAVLISMDQFKAPQDAPQMKLDTLSEQFDALLDRMQTRQARPGTSVAFNASPKQFGKADSSTFHSLNERVESFAGPRGLISGVRSM